MSDPCTSFGQLNLRDRQDLEGILQRDKDARLEGICIEYLFTEDVLAPAGLSDAVSDGWWLVSKAGATQGYYLFKLISGPLTSVDRTVIEHLIARDIQCFVVRLFDGHTNEFRALELKKVHLQTPSLVETPTSYQPIGPLFERLSGNRGFLPRIPTSGRTPARQEKVFQFLLSYQRLRAAAVQRLFANCFLSAYFRFVWDIDGFLNYGNRLAVFEVKQKYPTPNATFGINVGVARWMHWFMAQGLEVYHFVLTKPIWDYRLPALDFVSNPLYREKSVWLAVRISAAHFAGRVDTAPSRTSIFADTPLNFYHVPVSSFCMIKKLGAAQSNLKPFLKGQAMPVRGLVDIPRVR